MPRDLQIKTHYFSICYKNKEFTRIS